MLWEIVWLAAALLWGTFRLIVHRNNPSLIDEDTWGFGQVFSILLSVIPLWTFLGTLHESVHPPLAIDTSVTTMCSVDRFGRPDQHSWFNPLVGFMFGTATVLAMLTVCLFSGSEMSSSKFLAGSDVLYSDYGKFEVFIVYLVAFSWSVLASAIFISLAFAFELGLIGSSKVFACWARFTANWSPRTQARFRV